MRFLENRFHGRRKLTTAFMANYRRFMDTDVNDFPNPSNVMDEATSEAFNADIAEIRIAPTRRNLKKRTRTNNNNNEDYEYDYDDDN